MSRILLIMSALVISGTLLHGQQYPPYPGWGVLLRGGLLPTDYPVYSSDDEGVTTPRLLKMPRGQPNYPGEAVRRKIQGKVTLEFIVREDGTVDPETVNVTCSVDAVYGLDDAAVRATKLFLFTPGTKDGKPVAVRISHEMSFSHQNIKDKARACQAVTPPSLE